MGLLMFAVASLLRRRRRAKLLAGVANSQSVSP
jgi:hypothetical protein